LHARVVAAEPLLDSNGRSGRVGQGFTDKQSGSDDKNLGALENYM